MKEAWGSLVDDPADFAPDDDRTFRNLAHILRLWESAVRTVGDRPTNMGAGFAFDMIRVCRNEVLSRVKKRVEVAAKFDAAPLGSKTRDELGVAAMESYTSSLAYAKAGPTPEEIRLLTVTLLEECSFYVIRSKLTNLR